eukprot:1538862-Lingulodinium_polyedra.AAC.1
MAAAGSTAPGISAHKQFGCRHQGCRWPSNLSRRPIATGGVAFGAGRRHPIGIRTRAIGTVGA